MAIQIEKIYYLENPEEGIKKVVTESELKFDNIIKDVFGVAFVGDLPMMIHYNKKFQECICKANNINENEITLDLIFRVASKKDLAQLRDQYIEDKQNHDEIATPPFNSTIQLHEGIFQWNNQQDSYIKVNEMNAL